MCNALCSSRDNGVADHMDWNATLSPRTARVAIRWLLVAFATAFAVVALVESHRSLRERDALLVSDPYASEALDMLARLCRFGAALAAIGGIWAWRALRPSLAHGNATNSTAA